MIKILIVEDEDLIRQGLVNSINWINMNAIVVDSAKNGLDGLEKIEKHKPDVVLTDIRMPKLDGLTMVDKAMENGAQFETIVLTSYSDFEYATTALRLKVFDYILKPVDETKLSKIVLDISKKLEKEKYKEDMNKSVLEFKKVLNIEDVYQSSINDKLVTYTLNRIREDYATKLSIKTIADELEISTSYLSRSFKQVTNNTFLELLNKYRVLIAMEMLKSGEFKVYEISEKVGFIEYKHFFAIFKKYAGIAPTAYAKTGFSE